MSGLKKLRTTLDSLKLGSVHMSSPGTADALLSLDVDGELRMATDGSVPVVLSILGATLMSSVVDLMASVIFHHSTQTPPHHGHSQEASSRHAMFTADLDKHWTRRLIPQNYRECLHYKTSVCEARKKCDIPSSSVLTLDGMAGIMSGVRPTEMN